MPDATDTMLLASPILADAAVLVSWWKALILMLPFVPWAWLVSGVFDKHAARFYLGREAWGAAHCVCGVVALGVAFLLPIAAWWGFLVAFLGALLVLGADVAAFVAVTNRSENVPEQHRLKLDFSRFAEAAAAKKAAKQASTVSLTIKSPDGSVAPVPAKETPEYELRVAAEELFLKGALARASQIEVLPTSKEGVYSTRFLVDGVHQGVEQVQAQQALRVIDFWKAAAKLDLADRRRKLVGTCVVSRDDLSTRIRATASGVRGGMRLVLALNPEDAVKRKIEDTGLTSAQIEALKGLPGRGVVLLSAPPLNGATTSLYSFLQLHDAYTSNVQTIEADPQTSLEGVRQVRFNAADESAEYATSVRSILRRDPDVLSVAELADNDTAREIARADVSRTRIYVSLRADSALAAVQVYTKAVGTPADAAKSLSAAVAQKLARKLCTNCRVPYAPPAEQLAKLGLPADKVKQLFKRGGQVLIRNKPETCPVCQGVGYEGQTGLFEVYPIEDAERRAIAEQDWAGLRAAWKKRGLPSVQQVALRRLAEGVTSVEEIARITAPGGKPQKPGAAPAQAEPEAVQG